jgi:hypothetical protein
MGGSQYSETNNDAAFKRCTRGMIIEVRPYVLGEALPESVKISAADQASGSPTEGDVIARDPKDKKNQWLIAKAEFDFYTMLDPEPTPPTVPGA